MLGCELAGRFALPPNSKSYCGKAGFPEILLKYLTNRNNENATALSKALSRFYVHYSYLSLIAKANQLNPFDKSVAEAFWIGNNLLKNVSREEVIRLIKKRFCGRGLLAQKNANNLVAKMPFTFVAHHSFHVLHIHTVTGAVVPTTRNLDLCLPSWGRVIRISRDYLTVKSQRLVRRNNRFYFLPCIKKLSRVCARINLLPKLEIGNLVASHWGVAVMKITPAQASRLKKYTKINMDAINDANNKNTQKLSSFY